MFEPRGWHNRGYLPHFDDHWRPQLITYRLSDALPADVLARLNEVAITDQEKRAKIETYLDAGAGCCALREPRCADVVIENWHHFDGSRYRLLAWVVMPNHVHVLIEVRAGQSLSSIVQSWKSYTAKEVVRLCPGMFRGGRVWQPDYFDRFIRDEQHYRAAVAYVHENPVKAGLVNAAQEWVWSSARGRVVDGKGNL